MHAAITVAIPEAEITKISGEEIYVGKTNHSQGITVASLDWTHKFLQDVNGVILNVVEVVSLCIDSESLDPVICQCIEDYHAARHIESLKSSVKKRRKIN